MIIIKDNFFNSQEYKQYYNVFIAHQEMLKLNPELMWQGIPLIYKYREKIINFANNHFDLSGMVGIEEWYHDPSKSELPRKHIDKDEELYSRTGEIKTPLCSCVYYIKIDDDLKGSDLIINTDNGGEEIITPKTNRLVIFGPNMEHTITNWESGSRISLNINPWNHKLKLIYSVSIPKMS